MISVEGCSSGGIAVIGGVGFPRIVAAIRMQEIDYDIVLAGATSLLGEPAILSVSSVARRLSQGRGVVATDDLGRVELGPIHEDWANRRQLKEMGLGNKPALQIVPLDQPHRTIDVPVMSAPWSDADAGAWLGLDGSVSWPHPFAHETTVVTNLAALTGSPITEVVCWDDGELQMLAIGEDDRQSPETELRVVPLLTLGSADPTLAAVVSTPRGCSWWRGRGGDEWVHWRGWNTDGSPSTG